jgi:pyruvate kinase
MTKIIATIGPASESETSISRIISAGADVLRLNFSHGSYEWHEAIFQRIRSIAKDIPIILDTKGPEIRTGDIDNPIVLGKNSEMKLTTVLKHQSPEEHIIFISDHTLPNDVQTGDLIALDTGLILLEVVSKTKIEIVTRVKNHGRLGSRRHVNLVGKNVSLPTITEKDRQDIAFGAQIGVDGIALSFTRSAEDVLLAKSLFHEYGGKKDVLIWAKIESPEGIRNMEEIARTADAVMVARGDLGIETPAEEIPEHQIEILRIVKKYGKKGIVATEMLESMIERSRPTRAEISDITLAVWEGADYIMLSGETASGKHPIECVKAMRKIADAAEKSKMNGIPRSIFCEK